MDEGFEDFVMDDWSETEEWDASDTWDDVDEEAEEDEDDEGAGGWAAGGTGWGDDDADGFDEPADEDAPGEATDWRDRAVRSPVTAQGDAGGRGMDAWDFGTAAAVGGWLLDRQADRIAEAVRQHAQAPPTLAAVESGQATAPAWWHIDRGVPLDPEAAVLQPGDDLERSRLAMTIRTRSQLGLEARLRSPATAKMPDPGVDPAALLFTIVITDLTPRTRVWVMFEERPGGFSTARLQPVFDGTGPPGRAYCFVDNSLAAVGVVEWGLARYGLEIGAFYWSGGM